MTRRWDLLMVVGAALFVSAVLAHRWGANYPSWPTGPATLRH